MIMMSSWLKSRKFVIVFRSSLIILYTSFVSENSFTLIRMCKDTSGTTGTPKGIVRETGGTVVALNWTMQNIFDISRGDIWFSGSDIGWVVGHSFIVYGPMIRGATTVLFEGKPILPNPGILWRIVE